MPKRFLIALFTTLFLVTACGADVVEQSAVGRPLDGSKRSGLEVTANTAPAQVATVTVPSTPASTAPVATGPVATDPISTGPSATVPVSNPPVQTPALVDAMATSVTPGGGGLARLVGSTAQARCIADRAVADIGEQRYRSSYGVTVSSLQGATSLLGINYDQIDAEAVGAAMASCLNLPAVFSRVLVADQMDPEVARCVTTQGRRLFEQMIVAELGHDRGLVEKIVNELEDLAEDCTYPEPAPEADPEPDPTPEPEPDGALDPELAPEPTPGTDPAPVDGVQP